MIYETFEFQQLEKGIGMIALNRPRQYNSINVQIMEELAHFWMEKQQDLHTHVLILRGNGEKGFCAGLDMKETMEKLSDTEDRNQAPLVVRGMLGKNEKTSRYF